MGNSVLKWYGRKPGASYSRKADSGVARPGGVNYGKQSERIAA